MKLNLVHYCLITLSIPVFADGPQGIAYQGRMTVNGEVFDGTGQFKFALVNAVGTASYWSNDGTSVAGSQPMASVGVPVSKGNYSVTLGSPRMSPIPDSVLNTNAELFLRLWFNDGVNGWEQLGFDQKLTAVPYARVAAKVPPGAVTATELASGAVTGDKLAPGTVQAGNLASGAAAANLQAGGQSGVAIGGIVLSETENPALQSAGYVKQGLTQLSETWVSRTGGTPPSGRQVPSAVWTGTEMIVWGGQASNASFNDGARYNPSTGSWTALPSANAPPGRYYHSAVWTGSEMIVWGGGTTTGDYLNTGARYHPGTNTWTALPTSGAPSARTLHTAIWTGTEMIVWGGFSGVYHGDGGRYNPSTNTWSSMGTAGAPSPRYDLAAVWTGTEMIVWGGYTSSYPNDGGRYNPSTNNWSAVTGLNAPVGRSGHIAVWTGSVMLVWGGNQCFQFLSCPRWYLQPEHEHLDDDDERGSTDRTRPAQRGVDGTGSHHLGWAHGWHAAFERRRSVQSHNGCLDPIDDPWRSARSPRPCRCVDGRGDAPLGRQ